MNTATKFALGLVIGLLLGAPAAAQSGTQTVTGMKLLITNPPSGENKLVFRSKAGSIALGGSTGDPTSSGAGGGSGSIRIVGANGDVTIPLPVVNWDASTGYYVYEDPSGNTCKKVQVKNGLKAVCKGPAVTYALNAAEPSVNVVLKTGSGPMEYCATFGGDIKKDGSDGKRFLAKDAPAGTCPVLAAYAVEGDTNGTPWSFRLEALDSTCNVIDVAENSSPGIPATGDPSEGAETFTAEFQALINAVGSGFVAPVTGTNVLKVSHRAAAELRLLVSASSGAGLSEVDESGIIGNPLIYRIAGVSTCPTPCGYSYPACDGVCPGGQVCAAAIDPPYPCGCY